MRTGSSLRVGHLVRAGGAGREAHGVARLQLFLELAVAVGAAQRRPAAQHEQPLLGAELEVVGADALAGREVVDAAADPGGADQRREPDAPRPVARRVLGVGLGLDGEHVDGLHRSSSRRSSARSSSPMRLRAGDGTEPGHEYCMTRDEQKRAVAAAAHGLRDTGHDGRRRDGIDGRALHRGTGGAAGAGRRRRRRARRRRRRRCAPPASGSSGWTRRRRCRVYVDGADAVDPELRLIKGAGGALVREKVVASASELFVCIVDESKLVGAARPSGDRRRDGPAGPARRAADGGGARGRARARARRQPRRPPRLPHRRRPGDPRRRRPRPGRPRAARGRAEGDPRASSRTGSSRAGGPTSSSPARIAACAPSRRPDERAGARAAAPRR